MNVLSAKGPTTKMRILNINPATGSALQEIEPHSEDEIERICTTIIAQFDGQVPLLYDQKDRERGYVMATDRQNVQHQFPLVTISLAVVTNRKRMIPDE